MLELRADMVTQAQDDVKANALQTAASNNVQRVVDRRTHEIQVRLGHQALAFVQAHIAISSNGLPTKHASIPVIFKSNRYIIRPEL